ncbi:DinB family protein [candidate division KSB1 bacterium]|nr:DinB family protein [candidate division KSB1 bacterium]
MIRPKPNECTPYYHTYISQVLEGAGARRRQNQHEETLHLLKNVSEEKALYRYAPDKWSVKELIGHVIDAERVFAYRALNIARNDKSELPGMEQDDYVKFARFDDLPLPDLLEEFRHVRQANIFLFKSFDEEMQMRKGIASGCEFTVRTFPYIIAGHEKHHQNVLKERYL